MNANGYESVQPEITDMESGRNSTNMGGEHGDAASTDMGEEIETGGEAESIEEPADFGTITEAQVRDATESLQQIEGLHPETWEQLDEAERVHVLQDVENHLAEIQERPPVSIGIEPMDPGVYGGYVRGEGITLSQEHIQSDDVREIVDSIVHEGRHAYQDYAIQNPGFVSDADLVESWRTNWDNYLTAGEYGQELYTSQPIETDAWEYGARIADAVFGA